MEIHARVFFSLWAIIGFLFLYLGIGALERTDLRNSIPPPILYLFKISLVISTCHSATYALVFRPKLIKNYYLSVLWVMSPILINLIISLSWYPIYTLLLFTYPCYYYLLYRNNNFLLADDTDPTEKLIKLLALDILTGFIVICSLSLFFPSDDQFGCSMILILNVLMILQIPYSATFLTYVLAFVSPANTLPCPPQVKNLIYHLVSIIIFVFFTSTASISGAKRFRRWPAVVAGENRIRLLEFAMGMAGTIVFQNYFRLTSFDDVVAFLYVAVAWLANLAMLLCPNDFGIFNFFLVNVIVGCTVSEFGLRATTWLVYGTCLVLYMLRLKLEALSVVDRGPGQEAVVVWVHATTTSYSTQSLRL